MKKRDSFIFYRSFYEAIKILPNKDRLKVFDAIAEYSLNFEPQELTGTASALFTLIQPQLEANNKRFISGSKAKQKRTGSEPEANKNVNDNVNVNVNVNENGKTPLSQRKRTGQRVHKEFRNFMEMKEHLAANHNKYKNIPIEFEGAIWKIGKDGIPWHTQNVDDMPFEQRKGFWLHLINYRHLLGDI